MIDLELLYAEYSVEQELNGRRIPPLIILLQLRGRFFHLNYKQQLIGWIRVLIKDLWTMITWNATLNMKYENLIVLAKIARVQSVSKTTCELTFSMEIFIKDRT